MPVGYLVEVHVNGRHNADAVMHRVQYSIDQ